MLILTITLLPEENKYSFFKAFFTAKEQGEKFLKCLLYVSGWQIERRITPCNPLFTHELASIFAV